MLYLSTSYFLLNLLVCSFLIHLILKSGKKNKSGKILILISWQFFIFLISESGIIETLTFPPRFALFFILPSFLFSGYFILKHKNASWLSKLSIESLTLFQSFRILVESLFLWSVYENILNELVSIEGYNYDMIFAASTPIAYWIYKKTKSLFFLKVWNYVGMTVLASVIFVFVTALYFPTIYGYETTPLTTSFLAYPFILVAGFMMPVAVFIHCLSIIKIEHERSLSD